MHYLLQLRNDMNSSLEGDGWKWDQAAKTDYKSLSIEECASHLFLFYLAGFETSSSAAAYCLWELSRNPDKMAKLQQEIDINIATAHGQITYDGIREMKYLDMCVKETMRLYPAALILNRICTKEYELADMHLKIPVGTPIIVSLFGIQRDEKYFPNASQFQPERFASKTFKENAYFPFGDGPRACIAKRMGEVMTKLAIIQLLAKFHFQTVDSKEPEFDNRGFTLVAKGGLNLKVEKRLLATSVHSSTDLSE